MEPHPSELRSKYKRSALGWCATRPPVVNHHLLRGVRPPFQAPAPEGNPSGLKSFTLWLTCALLPWNFFATAIGAGTGSVVGNASLIKKVYFPREYLVASTILSWLVSFLIEMLVLSFTFLLWGKVVFQWLPLVFLVSLFQAVFGLGSRLP